MNIKAGDKLELVDLKGVTYGEILVNKREEKLVHADFTPFPAYAQIRPVFDELEEIVNGQIFSLLDEVCDRIAALGLRVRTREDFTDVEDLQIFGKGMSFRIPPPRGSR